MNDGFRYPWMRHAYGQEEESEYRDIKQAQQNLKNAGFYDGPINGIDSPELREATVAAMQKQEGDKPLFRQFEYPWMREAYPKKDW